MRLRVTLLALCLTTLLFGEGRVVPLHYITSVLFRAKATLKVVQGDKSELLIEGDEKRVHALHINQEDHLLTIEELRPWYSFFRGGDTASLTCTLTLPSLSTLTLEEGPEVEMASFKTGAITIGLNGGGSLDLHLACDTANISLFGEGIANIAGSTGRCLLLMKGGALLHGKEFNSSIAIVDIEGSGNAEIGTVDFLDVTMRGVGKLNYSGTPRSVHLIVSGDGEVLSTGAPTLIPQLQE